MRNDRSVVWGSPRSVRYSLSSTRGLEPWALAFWLILCLFPRPGAAAAPPEAPQLRIEIGVHTGLVTQVAYDAKRSQFLTVSYDKTLRIWDFPSGRLVETLRIPIGEGSEGQIYGLALSPNGRIAAVTGWTGWEWDGQACIYFFDLESRQLIARLAGLPTMAGNLAFSPDGKRLVVPLARGFGLRIYDTSNFAIVASDTDYQDNVIGAHFDPRTGALATTSLDGHVRLYDASFKRVAMRKTGVGEKPVAIRFSPRDDLVAVGHLDRTAVALLSSRDLTLERVLEVDAKKGQKSLQRVAWSIDGSRLIGFGSLEAGASPVLHEWKAKSRWPGRAVRVSGREVTAVAPTPGGGFVFASSDPGVGALDASGTRIFFRSRPVADFRGAAESLGVSANGEVLEVPVVAGASRRFKFDIGTRTRSESDRPSPGLATPRTSSDRIRLGGLDESTRPTLNGLPLAIKEHEISHSAAIEPDGEHFVLGTGWSLTRWNAEGDLLWRRELAAGVHAVQVPASGRVVVAALGDGTIRWYSLADGAPLLALFPSMQDDEWVLWRPDGFYGSSARGDQLIGWQMNRGAGESGDFYRAVQFERVLYRPDLVKGPLDSVLGGAGDGDGRAQAATASVSLREIAPARIRMRPGEVDPATGTVRVDITAESPGLPLQDFAVYVNDIPITPSHARRLSGTEQAALRRSVELRLPSQENRVRVEIFNGSSMGIRELWLDTDVPAPPERGDLYLLAVGIDFFEGLPADRHLEYASADARTFASSFGGNARSRFKKVHTKVLADGTDSLPTRANIIEALRFLSPAKAEDTVVLFLASHGISDAAGNYLFVPRDAAGPDIYAALEGDRLEPPSLIAWHVFFDALRNSAGRRLLLVDTCQAQKIEGTLDFHSLAKRSAASAFALMAASKGDELSQEYALGGHGLFTYGLLTGLEGRSDVDGDAAITLEELFGWTRRFVVENRNPLVGEQTPQLLAPSILRSMTLR